MNLDLNQLFVLLIVVLISFGLLLWISFCLVKPWRQIFPRPPIAWDDEISVSESSYNSSSIFIIETEVDLPSENDRDEPFPFEECWAKEKPPPTYDEAISLTALTDSSPSIVN